MVQEEQHFGDMAELGAGSDRWAESCLALGHGTRKVDATNKNQYSGQHSIAVPGDTVWGEYDSLELLYASSISFK